MFNVGGPEFLVIILVALVVLGPQQLPKAMRTFGSVMAEVRKVSNSFQAEMRSAMDSVTETTASEKPKSATMTDASKVDATESDSAGSESDSDATVTEVVARNDGMSGQDGPADDPSTERPAVDPADRAAG